MHKAAFAACERWMKVKKFAARQAFNNGLIFNTPKPLAMPSRVIDCRLQDWQEHVARDAAEMQRSIIEKTDTLDSRLD